MTARADEGLGGMAAIAGLALAGTAALPIASGSPSILNLIVEAFGETWVDGVVVLLLVGAPYLFGLFLVIAAVLRSPLSALLLRIPVTIVYGELVLLALFLLKDSGDATAPWSLVGFVGVASLRGVAHARRGSTNVVWLARWGAMLIVGVFAWILLQVVGQGAPVVSPWATLGAALLAVASCRPRRA